MLRKYFTGSLRDVLEQALQYAARGWPIFQLSAGTKLPRKGTHGHRDAATDRATIEQLWTERPHGNIGLACGEIVVIDLDGPTSIQKLTELAAPHGGLPRTLTAQTRRGFHLYFRAPAGITIRTRNEKRSGKGADGIDVKGAGGFVVLPPSRIKNGFIYKWILEVPIVELPQWLCKWCSAGQKEPVQSQLLGPLPLHLQKDRHVSSTTERALTTPWTASEQARIMSALAAIPANCGNDEWIAVGMALQSLGWTGGPDGSDLGFTLWRDWSATAPEKFSEHETETRWRSFGRRLGVSLGSLYHIAGLHGWKGNAPAAAPEPPSPIQQGPFEVKQANGHHAGPTLTPGAFVAVDPDSPLIDLNEKFAAIGDVGGKCLVLGWQTSKVDDQIQVPSFQTFKAFSERFAHKYVMVRKPKGEQWVEEPAQMGSTWLKWRQRRSFEGIDLIPNGDKVLHGNVLNLWTGFGVPAVPGSWDRMKEHIGLVLARGDADALAYIVKWAAWAVQHPGEAAQAALVFRGAKGAGKGTFAHALRRIFGQHGLHVSHSKHMTGSFNAHLRQCLLLYADEAFWAGDKQGESTLKALITEPVMMIEQKGVDATQWRNRLHVVMTANAEWVVPASGDERRYAVFNVDEARKQKESYFEPLYQEMEHGGLSAMLCDLQNMDLGTWHPRKIVQTEALQQQKLRSLDPRLEWFEGLLQDGILPPSTKEQPSTIATPYLLDHARVSTPRLRDISATAIGIFLRSMGCVKMHLKGGNGWKFEPLNEARMRWETRFGSWAWDLEAREWGNRN